MKSGHRPVGLQTSHGEGLDEVMPVHMVEEEVIALVATPHQVIHGAGILDSHFARRDPGGLDEPNRIVKPESKI
jgi:hypothetical protein